jgi:hypothetical protein
MLIELIFIIIFIFSLCGVIFIGVGKIPALNLLPYNGTTGIKKHKIIIGTETKVKEILISFKKQIFLHKLLSHVKILILKTETKVDHLLHGIRKKAQQVEKEINEKKKHHVQK